jgi:dUTP pyrophosphatase
MCVANMGHCPSEPALYSIQNVTIPARGRALIDTGIGMTPPRNTYIRIAPRSGLAVKKGITTGAGVVDRDYTNSIKVVMYNLTDEPFTVDVGDRIAQAIVERICRCDVVEVDELDATERGLGGFGSTGK